MDEHVSGAITMGLCARGVDATTASDAGLMGAEDEQHLGFATENDRVVVTNDPDFLALNSQGVPHAGIAYFPQEKYRKKPGPVIKRLVSMHEKMEPEELHNRVVFL